MPYPEKKCLIITGGEFSPFAEEKTDPDLVIACDRGWQHAEKLGIAYDIAIGDFDSAPAPGGDIPVITHPVKKDDTDTMLAARYALEHDYKDITIGCAFGGRLDHALANIQTASFIVSNGGTAALYGNDTFAYAFTKALRSFPRREGYSFSVFSLSDRCTGVSIQGALYECDDIELTSSFPLGVSNGWRLDEIKLSVNEGIILVVESRL